MSQDGSHIFSKWGTCHFSSTEYLARHDQSSQAQQKIANYIQVGKNNEEGPIGLKAYFCSRAAFSRADSCRGRYLLVREKRLSKLVEHLRLPSRSAGMFYSDDIIDGGSDEVAVHNQREDTTWASL